jgi:hypothetical protein
LDVQASGTGVDGVGQLGEGSKVPGDRPDSSPHKGGSLADGVLICGTVQCPWQGSQFNVWSGGVKAGPADKPIATYRVHVGDGEVRLFLA